jgi:hypothetical protein
MCKRFFTSLILSLLVIGCANNGAGTSTIQLEIANYMTSCAWTVSVDGNTETITATFSAVPLGATITVTTTAESGDCTIASSSSATSTYSTTATNGSCVLASTLSTVTSVTVAIEPASGYADASDVADDTALLCP